jgi:hypothetical protein
MTKTAKIIFDQQTVLRGIKRLEERMKGLPSGTEIVWIESVPGGDRPRAKGTEQLRLPSDEVIREIQKYAESHNIKLIVYGRK